VFGYGVQHESLWVATLLVALFVLCATTFISHTVAALIIMPMVMTIGNGLHAVKVRVAACLRYLLSLFSSIYSKHLFLNRRWWECLLRSCAPCPCRCP